MTSRCKSGRRRNQVTFVVARRRLGRPGRRSAGSSPRLGGCKPTVRSMKRSLPRRQTTPQGATGSRVPSPRTKAREGVKRLERQPRRTQRRRGRGTLAQPSWEQERPVSAPAEETRGVPTRGWPGSAEPYKQRSCEVGESGAGVGAAHSTAEAVAAEPRKREGAVLGLRVGGR